MKLVNRPLSFDFYSENSNEYSLLHNIEIKYKDSESYEIYLALMMARSNTELASLKDIAAKAMVDERFQNIAFLVFDTTLEPLEFDRFIEYQANAVCSGKHGYAEQTKSHTDNAKAIISDWMKMFLLVHVLFI